MFSFVIHAALAMLLAAPIVAQAAVPASRFSVEIPKAEAAILSQIVEDDPASVPAQRKGGSESPAYTLYSATLPIPPLAQVKQ